MVLLPALALSEPEPARPPATFPVGPAQLIALLAAALGLAALAGRLIFSYSVQRFGGVSQPSRLPFTGTFARSVEKTSPGWKMVRTAGALPPGHG
jgi:hypothetical protein